MIYHSTSVEHYGRKQNLTSATSPNLKVKKQRGIETSKKWVLKRSYFKLETKASQGGEPSIPLQLREATLGNPCLYKKYDKKTETTPITETVVRGTTIFEKIKDVIKQ